MYQFSSASKVVKFRFTDLTIGPYTNSLVLEELNSLTSERTNLRMLSHLGL